MDAIINSGGISSFDTEGGSGNLSQEDKILLSRLLLLLNPTYQAAPVHHKDTFHTSSRFVCPAINSYFSENVFSDIKSQLLKCWKIEKFNYHTVVESSLYLIVIIKNLTRILQSVQVLHQQLSNPLHLHTCISEISAM